MKLSEVFKALEDGKTIVEDCGITSKRLYKMFSAHGNEFIAWWWSSKPENLEINDTMVVDWRNKYEIA